MTLNWRGPFKIIEKTITGHTYKLDNGMLAHYDRLRKFNHQTSEFLLKDDDIIIGPKGEQEYAETETISPDSEDISSCSSFKSWDTDIPVDDVSKRILRPRNVVVNYDDNRFDNEIYEDELYDNKSEVVQIKRVLELPVK